MGALIHTAIVVTGDAASARAAHGAALRLVARHAPVTNLVPSDEGGHRLASFAVLPEGSYAGYAEAARAQAGRRALLAWLADAATGGAGGGRLSWVEVAFGPDAGPARVAGAS